MKKLIFAISLVCFGAVVFVSCEKNSFSLKENTFINGKASLKVNFISSYQANPSYQIKVDGIRVSSNLTYATPFPGGGLNTGGGNYADYLAVEPGERKITISRPYVGTNNDSVELAAATVTLAADKFYSLYFADTAANTTSILLEDDLKAPDSGFVKYRVVNLIPDLAAGVDIYFGTGATSTTSTKVAGPIAYKASSQYFTVPINTGTVWSFRPGGAAATTTATASYTSASTVTNQRVFTIITRGYNSQTAAPRAKAISFIYNR